MGEVYEAVDERLERHVALKVLSERVSGVESLERFLQEARLAASLSHPNLVAVYDVGETEESGLPYIVMELVEGRPLGALLEEERALSPDRAVRLVAQAARGLQHAHERGIVHRDIKPGNLLVTADETVKIADFGIARLGTSELTRTGQLLGTPHYMAPEQVTGEGIDGRADLFSLGVVLYELVTGEKPFSGDSVTSLAYRLVHTDPPPPTALRPSLPNELDPVVERCLAKDPAARFPDAESLATALEGLELAPASTSRDPRPAPPDEGSHTMLTDAGSGLAARRAPKARRPWRTALAFLAAVLVFALSTTLVIGWLERAPTPQEKEAAAPDRGESSGPSETSEAGDVGREGSVGEGARSSTPESQRASAADRGREPARRSSPGGAVGARPTGGETATLHMVFRHGQQEGRFSLERGGGKILYASELDAEGTFSKDELRDTFRVPAGSLRMTARLRLGPPGGEAKILEASEVVEFEPGQERYLQVKYHRFLGARRLSMDWDSSRAKRAFEE